MLQIGDNALHQTTGQIGQVCGYGHQLINGAYLTTLKVMLKKSQEDGSYSRFIEDLYSSWIKVKNS
ncbi:hypothetical protein [Calothrix sp. NIES-2098]|uniref:hypothetical protein n=1 Tax=Calothrix sp. NIES-2098 TaxID=1954171 RepID=UPI000B5E2D32|nr:hypothetical protein NIES2098_23470 [Calothrix sp. NIES-2098]